ncbi:MULTISPECIES: 2Fe-2S iron-sulfur cluster-binding protein [Streptomyces]|uniref:2Fe-2S ferredoxin n=1 Tax=Streptomyces demainii TaxID=588122 RepID=A0ABT9L2Y2_9ACTN|nr:MULTISPECIES: 2Fe-2S iron-sulfur cluster-binding protein [Streptomyces]MBW8089638.1 2Fe-2S iron-sulfur cluster binding domain-containing protein [Streptomyces hygroscopicus subsp. hygroscopicus]MCO8308350.1 2Fe-2S iron-sulfur cluster-binding protein [Streptomyces sp. RKCA744]MDN3055066.1 2Fe-2S iron-sulfur cluster-binding protein [Streptomyces sp. SRF1]MDP9615070.1 2Fe-2S ferredoxin [Streptomyces demainii]
MGSPEMVAVTFVGADGSARQCSGTAGESLMRAAVRTGIREILAECGGIAACATCHCYVEPPWDQRLDPRSDVEEAMLEAALDPTEFSRLSCQITLSPALDGLVVRLPADQI